MKPLADLERQCICDVKSRKPDEIEKLILHMFDEGERLSSTDVEKAFIYCGRGLNMLETLRKFNRYNCSKQLISRCAVIQRTFNRLRDDLCSRYLDLLDVCDDPLPSPTVKSEPNHFPGRWMPPEYFYNMYKTEAIFLVDVRPGEDYTVRRISGIPQVNFGSNITSGITITTLENRFDNDQRSQWNSHKSAKVIVIMDENTGSELITNPDAAENFQIPSRCRLKIIYDALVTYNAEKSTMPSVVFLSGGLEEFEKRYPTLVSTSSSYQSKSKSELPSVITYNSITDDIEAASSSTEPPSNDAGDENSVARMSYQELHRLLNESTKIPKLASKATPIPPHFNSSSPRVNSVIEKPSKPSIDRSIKPQTIPKPIGNTDEKPRIPEVNRATKPQFATQNGDMKPTTCVRPPRPNLKHIPPIALRRGLVNMGNTCYMNSTLQCLLHTPVLWNYFMQMDPSQKDPLVNCFSNFVQLMSDCQQYAAAFSPIKLKACFEFLHPMFAGGKQQDSQEFLILLLDSLHEALKSKPCKIAPMALSENVPVSELAIQSWNINRARDDSIILDWFNGQLRSNVKCHTCGRVSDTFDEFMYLSVPVPERNPSDLMECIRQFFKPETLVGGSQWLCPQCKAPREAMKTFDIWRFPEYLIIHFKRFYCSGVCLKIENLVTFPLSGLDLSKFTKNTEPTNCKYDLYGVINHYGHVDSGHYVAFCYDSVDKKWFNFDDSRVAELSPSRIQTASAYVLFYRRSIH
ncbi:hypothetical protein Aperf_G00000074937 [Anoplocephala perfoliata]